MKLLFIGKDSPVLSLMEQIVGPGHVIIHCADGAEALTVLEKGTSPPQLVVLEGQAAFGEGEKVAGAVRAMGYDVPMLRVSLTGSGRIDSEGPWRSALVCAIDRISKRRNILSCMLDAGNWPIDSSPTAADILLEYSAAPKKRRGMG